MSESIDSLIGNVSRDEQGRFKSVTPAEPVAEPVTVEATPAIVTPIEATPVDVTPQPVTPVVVPVTPVEPPELVGLRQGMIEERRKRQDLERQLEALKQPKVEVDPWTDLPGALKSEREALKEELFLERCNLTAELARTKYKDYDAVQQAFVEAAQANPGLFQQLRRETNPAEFAYKQGLLHRELGSVNGDMGAYRTKLEADIRKQVEAEWAAKHPTVPTSLNSDTSPVATTPVYAGPPPLKSLLRINDKRN
jgi:hypothetical protein